MRSFYQTTAILLLALLLPAVAMAHDFEVDGIFYSINGNEASVTFKGSTYDEYDNEYRWDVTIPETVTYDGVTYRVTSIDKGAFGDCHALNRVTIGNAVTAIGKGAFWKCDALEQVDIPNSVTTIAAQAFAYCSSLSSVNIPNSVTTIGDNAFFRCDDLTAVNISDMAAWFNISFENYTSNPLMYAHHLYLNGTEVTDLTVPESVTSIGQYAFCLCYGLSSVSIGNSVTSIGDAAFDECTGLKYLAIGNSVKSIGNYAFGSCSGLTSIIIPASVTSIGDYAFFGCSSLSSIVVESGNPVYDSRGNCNALIESATNTLINGCQNTIIPNSVTTIYYHAFSRCNGLTSVTIPSSVTTIYDYAFYQCSDLTSLTIPKSVTTINNNPFMSCTSLSSIVVEDGNPVYDSRDNCNAIIKTISNTLVVGCKNTLIPSTVTTIGSYAFGGCRELTAIDLPNSVVTIGDYAFFECSGLNNITIPNSVTTILEHAFRECTSLKSVTIGRSVSSIGSNAFLFCTDLTDIICHVKNPPQLGDYVFEFDWLNYKQAKLYVPESAIEAYRNHEVWGRFEYIVPLPKKEIYVNGLYFRIEDDHAVVISSPYDNPYSGDLVIPSSVVSDGVTFPVTAIGDGAFAGCEGLTSITIPSSVTSIGSEAFGSTALTSIVIPSSVTFIDEYAFIECKSMQSMVVESDNPVYDSRDNCNAIIETASNTLLYGCQETVIPNTVTAIGNHAFEYCTKLKGVVIPNSVITIGESAFYGCSGMTSLTIGNSVTRIGDEAFEYCTKLTSVDIPNSVKYIGFEAFAYCYRLTSVTIGKAVTTIENGAFYCCESLTDVYCHIADPTNVISLDEEDDECEVFYSDYGNYAQRTLHVPAGSLTQYRSSEYWNPFFGQIVEMAEQSGGGDVNGDGAVNIGDVNLVINTILSGNQGGKGDVNNDGVVNISDVNFIINYILTH